MGLFKEIIDRDYIEPTGLTYAQLASKIGITNASLIVDVSNVPISRRLSEKLGKEFNMPKDYFRTISKLMEN